VVTDIPNFLRLVGMACPNADFLKYFRALPGTVQITAPPNGAHVDPNSNVTVQISTSFPGRTHVVIVQSEDEVTQFSSLTITPLSRIFSVTVPIPADPPTGPTRYHITATCTQGPFGVGDDPSDTITVKTS
jgi:hypothetical protein